MPVKHKYLFLCVLVICLTLLCFIWIVQDRLCEFSIKERNSELRAVLAYESGK
ncbi:MULTISPECIES: Hok/Gef family protein [Atlantibacter]|uniref:Hok/Gef family protein n=1 Tax=Atlantibacter TaxID=1903434 RepID=UPI000EC19A7F|nr:MULTISPECIES: Hok/Gef family protein [Atlantibacter]MCQ4967768.1 Hok/Gef family protein [Enterobacteriaceae bacterium DFI.7.85]HAP81645.1 Hok/Gef family protein [Enterobacteriaceae bacterium]MBW9429335.1 Hok/Gef family protein [Atlantibacter hermannii]MDU1951957.1 Hok/Gef family protein [Atlantibacter hermannii]MDW4576988.1 Hok/Gef family protein [Atlantibacter hermannii]